MKQATLTPVFAIPPQRISTMINRSIVEQHVDEAGFQWLQHTDAVQRPDYTLEDIVELDNTLEANLDGIYLAGETGWQLCQTQLTDGEEYLFPAMVMALRSQDPGRQQQLLKTVNSENAEMFIGALGWVDYAQAKPVIEQLLNSTRPFYQYLGVAACGLHRQKPSVAIQQLLQSPIPLLKVRVIQLIGELKYHDLKVELAHYLRAENQAYRFWSAWSLALLGERYHALPVLESCLHPDSAYYQPALQVAIRIATPDGRKRLIYTLAKSHFFKSAITATGIAGYVDGIGWLIKMMEQPELARIAGEAFSLITGVDLEYNDLVKEQAEDDDNNELFDDDDDDDNIDEDEQNLPIPEPLLVAKWWQQYQRDFKAGTRYLAGNAINDGNLLTLLQSGRQRQAAALELALSDPTHTFLPTSVKGSKQQHYGLGGKY
ncbi:TIGR02270 family protein [Serratia silvae]|uniref:TIGR02270 family protein n=1 Tax=Serratia silvae TaxID=2824122 RepID=A0ABT0KAW0_9GAMM|nr:TIGR02270 family protein [Serratia silvae]MCL1029171.1 TIGR02270 family protein [Serratia silvae]